MAASSWVRPGLAKPHRPVQRGAGLLDRGAVPQAAVLLLERHDLAGRVEARCASRVMQKHQAEQTERLGFVRHQLGEQAGQANRLRTQVLADQLCPVASEVALVEQAIHHREHGPQTFGQLVIRRHPVGNASIPDLLLGPHQALGHRIVGNQERARDLRGGQTAQRPQCQGNLGLDRQCGVAAGEDQPKPVITNSIRGLVAADIGRGRHRKLPQLDLTHGSAAKPVHGSVPGSRLQPTGRVGRHTVTRPTLQRPRERVLSTLFGQIPVTGDTDQVCHHPAPLGAERLTDCPVDLAHASHSGRTSIVPNSAAGFCAASSIASSRSSHSTT
jgi:hypothetical protein